MQFTAESLRTLKGAPLSILMAMMLARQPVSAQYLESVTGYTDKPTQAGLRVLSEFGYITRNGRYNWQLASNIEQLPLMNPELEENYPQDVDRGAGIIPTPKHEDEPGTRKFSPGQPSKVSDFGKGHGIIPCPESLVVSSRLNQKELIRCQPTTRDNPEKIRDEKLALLDQYGILDPKRGKLASNPYVSPRSIAYHCENAPNTGMAIYRIEHGWKVPASYVPGLKDKPWQKYLIQEED